MPTANHPQFDSFLRYRGVVNGVYFGWGRVEQQEVRGVVANIGYSPTFEGEVSSLSLSKAP